MEAFLEICFKQPSHMKIKLLVLCALMISLTSWSHAQDTLQGKNIDAVFYKAKGNSKQLIVGLGGSEGGNAWASRHWKATRDEFLDKGYAFLAIGYFNTPHSPKLLEKIALEDLYQMIEDATHLLTERDIKIALIGGSRGADLALLLASYYPQINCVIAISASHVVFPGNTLHFSTSSFTWQQKELPFVPVNEAAYPFLLKRDLRGAFSAMLTDTIAENKAMIRVETIKGPVLLLSGKQDEICPSTVMCDKKIKRLKAHQFEFTAEHLSVEGGHSAPLQHFDKIFQFLEKEFRATGPVKII